MKVRKIKTGIAAPNDGAMRTAIVRKVLESLGGPYRVADLGAGPCIFSKIARDAGHEVTAIDARTVRKPSDEDLGSVRFVHADVREFDLSGFEVILFLGLFYHLEIPDQLEMLKRCRHATVILDTQVHVPELVQNPNPEPWENTIVHQDGFEGVVFPEGDNPMASVGNKTSFWHTDESMIRIFERAGYEKLQVIDPLFTTKYGGRRFFVGS